MKVVTKKICMAALIIGMSGGAYAQAGDGVTYGENGTLVPGANSAGTTTPGAIAPGR
jgi:hypothetical protein